MNRRALLLTSNFPRWSGDSTTPFVLHLAQDLGGEGWEVDVLAPHAPGAATREPLGGVEVHRFRYAVPAAAQTVCYGGGALVNLRHRPRERLKLPLLVASEWMAAARLLRSGRYDLVNAHWLLPQGFVATSLPGSVPVVTTVHGGDIFGLRGPGMAGLKRWTAKRSSVVTVNSGATYRAVRDLGGPTVDIETVPMGADVGVVDPSRAAQLRADHSDGKGPLLVFVGRLVEEKGLGDLLDALRLLRRDADVRLVVLGEGQDRARFVASASDLGPAVRFLGWIDPADVGNHLAAADVFVAPSRTGVDGWTEGQGLTVIEAMLAGTPVVASRSGGIVDSIADGQTGLLVDEGSPEQLAEAVSRLLDDPALRARLAGRAKEEAERRFTRRASARRFAAVFERVARGLRTV